MFKDFLLRKMLSAKMKNLSQEDQDKIIGILEKNPEFFQTVAIKLQQKITSGQDQQVALMDIMNEHKAELEGMMKNS